MDRKRYLRKILAWETAYLTRIKRLPTLERFVEAGKSHTLSEKERAERSREFDELVGEMKVDVAGTTRRS